MTRVTVGFATTINDAQRKNLGDAATEEAKLKAAIEAARADGVITAAEELAIAGQAAAAAAAQQGKPGYYTGSVTFEAGHRNGQWAWSYHGAPYAPATTGTTGTPPATYPTSTAKPGAAYTLAPWQQLQSVAVEVMKLEPSLGRAFDAATLGTILGRAAGVAVTDARVPQSGGAKVFIPAQPDLQKLAGMKSDVDGAVAFVRGLIPAGALDGPKLIGGSLVVPAGSNMTFIARNIALELGIDTVALAKSQNPADRSRANTIEAALVNAIATKNGVSPNNIFAGQTLAIPDRAALDALLANT